MLDPVKHEIWRQALEKEAELRLQLLEIHQQGSSPSGDKVRAWWQSVADLLFEYRKHVASNDPPESAPMAVIEVLNNLAGELAVGTIPEYVKDASKEGNPSAGPQELRDKQLAVAYHRASTRKLFQDDQAIVIDDPHPTKTLSSWYGVAPNTIRDWVKSLQPAYLGVNTINGEILVLLVEKAAARYLQNGRSQVAIASRNSKRASGTKVP